MSEIRPSDGDSWQTTVLLCLAFFVVDLLKRLLIKILQTRNIKNLLHVQKSLEFGQHLVLRIIKQSNEKQTNL